MSQTTTTPLIGEAQAPAIKRPGYQVYDHPIKLGSVTLLAGVWYHGETSKGPDDEPTPYDEWLCGPLHVDALSHNERQNAGYGRLLRLRNADNQWITWVMPAEMLAGRPDAILSVLLDLGLELNHHQRAEVIHYLAEQQPRERVIAATSTGWLSPELFVMPHQPIGEGRVVFQSDSSDGHDYQQGGTLEGWQAGIGALCEGNPLLMLAVCAALAGPLLYHVQQPGGGFHIIGDSSTGKSSAILAGASVWGHAETFRRTWRATGNGLEGIASQRNDTFLALDELGEADPKEVGSVVYALANGTGKARASRSGSARAAKRWRVILLSSGELGLSALMAEGGKRTQAGQEIRLLDIPARRSYGAWDNLHGMPGGRELSDAIQRNSTTHYGHAGPLFIRKLIASAEQPQLSDLLAQFHAQYTTSNGQEARAAARFALLAMAGELATEYGILPTEPGTASTAMLQLFDVWLAGRGSGPHEDKQILKGIADFIAKHGDQRFSSITDHHGEARDRAGYWESTPDGGRGYLFNRPGLEEAGRGYDLTRIVQALDTAGAIAKRDPGKHQVLKRLPGGTRQRFYCINPDRLDPE